MRIKNLSICGTTLLLLSACSVASRLPVPCTATTDFATCTTEEGCTLVFTCAPDGRLDFPEGSVVTFNIRSIYINQPYLLQAAPGFADPKWYNTTLNCTTTGASNEQIQGLAPSTSTIWTCPNYLPIATDDTIIGTLDKQTIAVHSLITATTSTSISIPNTTGTDCGDAMCGQAGTTVQRMFDCAQRITNYAGFGNGNGTFTPFQPYSSSAECPSGYNCDPTGNWFLVSSPGTGSQQCFWLSPVFHPNNPVTQTGEFDSAGTPMAAFIDSRFLWSGLSSNSATFFETIGDEPYDIYGSSSNEIMAVISGTPHVLTATLCQVGADPERLSGDVYNWQLPSYPMAMSLTGGNNTSCDIGGDYYINNWKLPCNIGSPKAPLGFRAVDPVPGFSQSNITWTSSGATSTYAWTFYARLGASPSVSNYQHRCVSTTW